MAINYIPADVTQGLLFEEPQKIPQLPEGKLVAYDGENILPTAEGYKSFFGISNRIGDSTLPSTEIQEIVSFVTEFGQVILLGLCGDGLWVRAAEGDGTATVTETSTEYTVAFPLGKFSWTRVVPLASASPWKLWTKVLLNNRAFFYANGLGHILEVESLGAGNLTIKKLEPTYIISAVAKQHKIQIELDLELGNSSYKSVQIDGSYFTKYVSREADVDDFVERIRDAIGGGDISGKSLSVTKGKWTFNIPEFANYNAISASIVAANGTALRDISVSADLSVASYLDYATRGFTADAVTTLNEFYALYPTLLNSLDMYAYITPTFQPGLVPTPNNVTITAWDGAQYTYDIYTYDIVAHIAWMNLHRPPLMASYGINFTKFAGTDIKVTIPMMPSVSFSVWRQFLAMLYHLASDAYENIPSYFVHRRDATTYEGVPFSKPNVVNFAKVAYNPLDNIWAGRPVSGTAVPNPANYSKLPVLAGDVPSNIYINFMNPLLYGSDPNLFQASFPFSGGYWNITITTSYIDLAWTSSPLYTIEPITTSSTSTRRIYIPNAAFLGFANSIIWFYIKADATQIPGYNVNTLGGGNGLTIRANSLGTSGDYQLYTTAPAFDTAWSCGRANYSLQGSGSHWRSFKAGTEFNAELTNIENDKLKDGVAKYQLDHYSADIGPPFILISDLFGLLSSSFPTTGTFRLSACKLKKSYFLIGYKGMTLQSYRHGNEPSGTFNLTLDSSPTSISIPLPASLSTSQQIADHIYTGLHAIYPLTTVTKTADPEATLTATITKEFLTYDGHTPIVAITKDGTETGDTISLISSTSQKMAEVDGIFKARGRLGAWKADGALHLSSPTNPMDFVPSISTQANELRIESIRGKIIQAIGSGEGFTLFNSGNVVRANYNGEQNSFNFAELYPVGIADPRHLGILGGVTYFYTPTGLMQSAGNEIQKLDYALLDYLAQFKIPLKISSAAERYLIIEITEEYLDNLFYDRLLRKGVAVSYPKAYQAPATSSSGILQPPAISLDKPYVKAFFFDTQLGKWGICTRAHKALISYAPWNVTSELISLGDNTYTAKLGAIGTDGKTYIFDEHSTDSYILFGKWGLTKRGLSRLTQVDVGFTELPKATVSIETSFEGSRIDFANVQTSQEITEETRETLHFFANGKWHNVKIAGIFELNFLNVGGFGYGR